MDGKGILESAMWHDYTIGGRCAGAGWALDQWLIRRVEAYTDFTAECAECAESL
jgi:hypothetical protein